MAADSLHQHQNIEHNNLHAGIESDGGSLPFNGFESCSESRITGVESTEDDEGGPTKRDYVLVSSTVKENECTTSIGSGVGNGHQKDSRVEHPALKLKLVIKNKYEKEKFAVNEQMASAPENTLAGAIELKKRLLKQRRKAKREKKRAKMLQNQNPVVKAFAELQGN